MSKIGKRECATVELLRRRASTSECTYRVSAVAFDAKGDILGHSRNVHSKWDVLANNGEGRPGTAIHAERQLMARYGQNCRTIFIARVGRSGNLLPISPCKACQKVADKLGVKIVSVGANGGKINGTNT